MKQRVLLVAAAACICLFIAAPVADAYVDAKFWVKDDQGKAVYMLDDDNEMIYGNVLAGRAVLFDGSQSQSYYGRVDKYYWDWNNDGSYDAIRQSAKTYHTFNEPGVYRVKLMAVDQDGPPGAADTYIKQVSVVASFQKPVPRFTLSPVNSSHTYQFNASTSYDPDGYIRYYRWDFTGNGVIDAELFRRSNASHSYTSDGYYTVTLTTEDWDGLTNSTRHIVRVGSSGGISETERRITVVNERDGTANVTVTVNNWKTITADVADEETFTAPFRQGGDNEVQVACNGTARSCFCSGDSIIYLTEDGGIATGGDDTPGFGLLLFMAAAMLALLLRRGINI
ncbi:MAG: PKD domain-containing protein [Candidatus Thermoplasmatota archaeon]|nr:PKD domain-containing protein [Candidatus Thermoplasmatota archaeon]